MRRQSKDREHPAEVRLSGETAICSGAWISPHVNRLCEWAEGRVWPSGRVVFDLGEVRHMDTAGAWLLSRWMRHLRETGRQVDVRRLSEAGRQLLELVSRSAPAPGAIPHPRPIGPLEALGRGSAELGRRWLVFLGFVGEVAVVALALVPRPWRVRWALVAQELGDAGYKALGIVGLLAFLLGLVIAYQGGVLLRQYGGNVYVGDLVGLSMLRELAPIITAIIVAGRTGSAYTAQIGTMKVSEELDALRSMAMQPIEVLVVPKLIALTIALPLLTVFADVVSVVGGMLIANAQFGVGFNAFLTRVEYAVTVESFLIGVGKAPVFAAMIATIGCYQGFRVHGSAESVGHHTTLSVVQSITAVIVVDAAFSVAFSRLGI